MRLFYFALGILKVCAKVFKTIEDFGRDKEWKKGLAE